VRLSRALRLQSPILLLFDVYWDYTDKPASWQTTVDMTVEIAVMDKPHNAVEYFWEFVQPYVAR